MLLNDFFTIQKIDTTDTEIKALLVINAVHKIFEGHFPGQPVVPGVCMIQMVKEILETVTGRATNLVKAPEIKFLVIIDPTQNNIIGAELKYKPEENGNMNVTAILSKGETIYFKFKGLFHFL